MRRDRTLTNSSFNCKQTGTLNGLLLVPLLILWIWPPLLSGVDTRKDGTEQTITGATNAEYPDTPAAVVEAFIRAGLAFDQLGYMHLYADDRQSGYDCLTIASSYRIVDIDEQSEEAFVTVVYQTIGAVCDTLFLDTKTERIRYNLVKKDGLWRIWAPIEGPRISIDTAIQSYKKDLRDIIKKKKSIELSISVLRKYQTITEPEQRDSSR
ncbi:hypothetical protein ACFL2Q_04700 [Thermodesulfobacteriota bacterium]